MVDINCDPPAGSEYAEAKIERSLAPTASHHHRDDNNPPAAVIRPDMTNGKQHHRSAPIEPTRFFLQATSAYPCGMCVYFSTDCKHLGLNRLNIATEYVPRVLGRRQGFYYYFLMPFAALTVEACSKKRAIIFFNKQQHVLTCMDKNRMKRQ